MNQEVGIKVDKVYSGGNDFVRPNFLSRHTDINGNEVIATDLLIQEKDGSHICICGDNDWAFLALDLIKPIKTEAKVILKSISEDVEEAVFNNKKVVGIFLGLNDKRIMDVFFGGRGACKEIWGYPVLVNKHEEDLVEVIVAND